MYAEGENVNYITLASTDILRRKELRDFMVALCTEGGTAHHYILDEVGYGSCCLCYEVCNRVVPLEAIRPVKPTYSSRSVDVTERKAWGTMMRKAKEAKRVS